MKCALAVLLVACDPTPKPLIDGTWTVASDAGPTVQLVIDEQLEAELCVPALNVMIRLGAMTVERDALDRYHFRTTILDSALNTAVPLSLVGALSPAEATIGRALGYVEYVLRFCVSSESGSGRTLECDSYLGEELSVFKKLPEPTGAGIDLARCEDPTACDINATFLPSQVTLATCLGRNGCMEMIDDTTSLCDVIASAKRCPDALRACLLSRISNVEDGTKLDSACDAMRQLEHLPDVDLNVAQCEALATPLAVKLCNQVIELAKPTVPGDLILSGVGDVCELVARVSDVDLLCCQAE